MVWCSIVQVEDSLEHEKKARADVEKVKRKLEGDLKMTQETVEELEHAKREMEETIKKYVRVFWACQHGPDFVIFAHCRIQCKWPPILTD